MAVDTRLHLTVDPDLCQGHARCYALAPQLFDIDDVDGHARALPGPVPVDLEDKAELAVRSCPERAISLGRGPA